MTGYHRKRMMQEQRMKLIERRRIRNGNYCVPAASGEGGFYETRFVSVDTDSEFPHVTAERYYVSDFEDDRYIGRFCFGFTKDDNCDSGYHLSNMSVIDLAA